MPRPQPLRDAPEFVVVGYVTEDEQLVLLRLTRDCAPLARARGWMVWDDLVRAAWTPLP